MNSKGNRIIIIERHLMEDISIFQESSKKIINLNYNCSLNRLETLLTNQLFTQWFSLDKVKMISKKIFLNAV